MSDIDFKDDGTIIITLDKPYTLRVPTTGEYRRWARDYNTRLDEVRVRLTELQEAAEKATGKAKQKAEDDARDFSRQPLYETTIGWLQTVLDTLTEGFPSDPDDWPAWLGTSNELPTNLLIHWRTVPKASGSSDT